MSSRRDREGEEGDEENASDRQRLFSAMFLGRLPTNQQAPPPAASSQSPLPSSVPNDEPTDTTKQGGSTTQDHDAEDAKAALTNRLDGVLDQIDQQIPHDPIALRQKTLYKGALQMLQWQRDNYLVGSEYADWRRNDRRREQHQGIPNVRTSPESFDIPFDPAALGHQQVAKLASDFIPTPTVVRALTPIVAGLPSGALYDPTRNSMLAIIRGQQENLEDILKSNMLRFLDNPQNRAAMKNSTQGMLIRRTNNDNNNNSSETNNSKSETTTDPTVPREPAV